MYVFIRNQCTEPDAQQSIPTKLVLWCQWICPLNFSITPHISCVCSKIYSYSHMWRLTFHPGTKCWFPRGKPLNIGAKNWLWLRWRLGLGLYEMFSVVKKTTRVCLCVYTILQCACVHFTVEINVCVCSEADNMKHNGPSTATITKPSLQRAILSILNKNTCYIKMNTQLTHAVNHITHCLYIHKYVVSNIRQIFWTTDCDYTKQNDWLSLFLWFFSGAHLWRLKYFKGEHTYENFICISAQDKMHE